MSATDSLNVHDRRAVGAIVAALSTMVGIYSPRWIALVWGLVLLVSAIAHLRRSYREWVQDHVAH